MHKKGFLVKSKKKKTDFIFLKPKNPMSKSEVYKPLVRLFSGPFS